jgi:hypothetical protein
VADAGDPPPLRYVVETVAETRTGCGLVEMAEDGALRVEQAAVERRLSGLIELRLEGQVQPPLPARDFVMCTNGDRLPIDPNEPALLEEKRLVVQPAPAGARLQSLSLYLPNVVLLFRGVPEGVDDAELFFANLARETRRRDVVYLRSGDRLEGTVTALDKAGCLLSTEGRKVQTPWPKLAGIAWNTDRQARPRARKTYYQAVLEGGARLSFAELRFDEKARRWIGKTQLGPTVELPAASVLALDARQGPAVDLADLTPARYEHRPYLGVSWPLVKDAAVDRHSLRLAGSTYTRGIGLHAPCTVSYKLDGQYQRFESLVGLDAGRAPLGRARLAVLLDGKRIDLNQSKELTSADAPLKVRLDVRNIRTLTLLLELGTFGDVQAHVNWAKARLIKK